MIQPIFLCFERACSAPSRLIKNFKSITEKTGEHWSHDCKEINDLQDQLKDYYFSTNQNLINTMLSAVDEFCLQMKKNCDVLIDQYATAQKMFITVQSESSLEYIKTNDLVTAVLNTDMQVLEDNQEFFLLLRRIDSILEHKINQITEVDHKVTKSKDNVNQQFQNIFNLNEYSVRSQEKKDLKNEIDILKQQLLEAGERFERTGEIFSLTLDQADDDFTNFKGAASKKYDQLEVKYNDQTKNIKYLQDHHLEQLSQSKYLEQESIDSENQIKLLQQENILVHPQNFYWSLAHKHNNVQLIDQSVKNIEGDLNCVLVDQKMSFQEVLKVQLNITKYNRGIILLLCDLKMFIAQCHTFNNIQQIQGQISHSSSGNTQINLEQQNADGFTFAEGDSLEMQWDGPNRKFITSKMQTGEKQEFHVNFNDDAEVYFGVILCGEDSEVRII